MLHTVYRAARRIGVEVIGGVHGDRLVVVLGGAADPLAATEKLLAGFGDGPVVVGPAVPIAGRGDRVGPGRAGRVPGGARPGRPRPGRWPPPTCCPSGPWPATRRPGGSCGRTSTARWCGPAANCWRPWTRFFAAGGVLESAARALFVHPNTVRYRLRRVGEVTGFVPARPPGTRSRCGSR